MLSILLLFPARGPYQVYERIECEHHDYVLMIYWPWLITTEYKVSWSSYYYSHCSDTPLIDNLVTREFVSRPPSYRSIHKRVRDRKPFLRESSWPVCCLSKNSVLKPQTNHDSEVMVTTFLDDRISKFSTTFESRILLKTDSAYPKDTGLNIPWQPLGIPFAITPIGQLHQSPPSPIPGDLGRCLSHQSHVLEHRDTYGQAQVLSKGHQGSSVDCPCQPSFHWIKFWHVRNPLPQSIGLRLSVLVRYWAGQGEWSLSWTTSNGKKNQRTYHFLSQAFFGGEYSRSHLGWHFEWCFKGQISNLERLFSLKRGKRDVWALNFELSGENFTPSGDWLYQCQK